MIRRIVSSKKKKKKSQKQQRSIETKHKSTDRKKRSDSPDVRSRLFEVPSASKSTKKEESMSVRSCTSTAATTPGTVSRSSTPRWTDASATLLFDEDEKYEYDSTAVDMGYHRASVVTTATTSTTTTTSATSTGVSSSSRSTIMSNSTGSSGRSSNESDSLISQCLNGTLLSWINKADSDLIAKELRIHFVVFIANLLCLPWSFQREITRMSWARIGQCLEKDASLKASLTYFVQSHQSNTEEIKSLMPELYKYESFVPRSILKNPGRPGIVPGSIATPDTTVSFGIPSTIAPKVGSSTISSGIVSTMKKTVTFQLSSPLKNSSCLSGSSDESPDSPMAPLPPTQAFLALPHSDTVIGSSGNGNGGLSDEDSGSFTAKVKDESKPLSVHHRMTDQMEISLPTTISDAYSKKKKRKSTVMIKDSNSVKKSKIKSKKVHQRKRSHSQDSGKMKQDLEHLRAMQDGRIRLMSATSSSSPPRYIGSGGVGILDSYPLSIIPSSDISSSQISLHTKKKIKKRTKIQRRPLLPPHHHDPKDSLIGLPDLVDALPPIPSTQKNYLDNIKIEWTGSNPIDFFSTIHDDTKVGECVACHGSIDMYDCITGKGPIEYAEITGKAKSIRGPKFVVVYGRAVTQHISKSHVPSAFTKEDVGSSFIPKKEINIHNDGLSLKSHDHSDKNATSSSMKREIAKGSSLLTGGVLIERTDIVHSVERTTIYPILSNFLLKKGDDLRIDQACMAVLNAMNHLWKQSLSYNNGIWMANIITYKIIPMSNDFGIIEQILNCKTANSLITDNYLPQKLDEIQNLVCSTAGAVLSALVLGLRDRHKNNVLIRTDDFSVFNIDFTYILGKTVSGVDAYPIPIDQSLEQLIGKEKYWDILLCVIERSFYELRRNFISLSNLAHITFYFVSKNSSQYDPIISFMYKQLRMNETDQEAWKVLKHMINKAPKATKTKVKNFLQPSQDR